MTGNGYFQIGLFLAALLLLAWPLGLYMARVYAGKLPVYVRWIRPLESGLYRLAGIQPNEGMTWLRYALAFLAFNLLGLLVVYALQRLQLWLPLNPQGLANVTPDSAFNTAISFATNTNWQGYGGETTMSYLTQMVGLSVQNFVSAASGMAVLVAVVRGFVQREADRIGNFWVDLVRSTLYVLLPLSLILAVVLVSQGVVQTFAPSQTVELSQPVQYEKAKLDADGQTMLDAAGKPVMETVLETRQTIAVGPAASQIAIKQLGTNGGGFFNVNSAHPLENPTPLTNWLEMLAILLIPAALCITFGKLVGDVRQGVAIRRRRTGRQPAIRAAGSGDAGLRRRARRKHGGQGGALRYRQFGHVGHRHHRRFQWLGQRHARLLYPARRPSADVVDAIG